VPEGVDEGEDVVGPDARHRRLEVEGEGRAARRNLLEREDALLRGVAIDDDDVLELGQLAARSQGAAEELPLGDEDSRTGVGDDEADLLGRVLHVDGKRRRPDHHHREVAEVELRTIGEQQRHRLAAPEAQRGQPARQLFDPLAQLAPRP
jgi:hypothetical protein